jgi:hypothetical protein
MASVKLTNDMRDSIIRGIIEDKYRDRMDELTQRFAEFSNRMYAKCFSNTTIKKINDLPKGWLPEENDFLVEIAGQVIQLTFDGYFARQRTALNQSNSIDWDQRPTKRFPTNKTRGVIKTFDGGSSVHAEYQQIEYDLEKLNEEVATLKNELRGVLYSCSTSKRLLDTWPEIEPYLKDLHLPIPVSSVPVQTIETLNEKLGLEKAA